MAAQNAIPAAQPGDVIDRRYEVVRIIGRGATADVFEARDRRERATVALKILRAAVARDPEARERFAEEVRLQRMVRHRNVARLHGAGVAESGAPYLAMELLRGTSLLTVLRRERRVPVIRAASYAWQALHGLAATHAVGILHRDLKPANLMLEPSDGPVERVVLIDFGFAALGVATGLTQRGHVVGSLSYLAPERLRGEGPDQRADIYGVGCIFYELLVGRPPFERDDDMGLIMAHLNDAPEPPSRAAPDAGIPPAVDAVVLRALAKDPTARAASAQAMADEIDHAING